MSFPTKRAKHLSSTAAPCVLRNRNEIRDYIARHELVPKHLLCTHGHFDHVFGNSFIRETYGLLPEMHRSDWELIPVSQTRSASFSTRRALTIVHR